MKRVLCYGDSNTWGLNPTKKDPLTGKYTRHDEHVRWAGVMRDLLGQDYFVWEAGLNGRTTVFDDPIMPTRNGAQDIEMVLQMCDPVDCIIFALGTNDTKLHFGAPSLVITQGMERLIHNCRAAMMGSRSEHAKIILACPLAPVADQSGEYEYGFGEVSTKRGEELRQRYRALAQQYGCAYIDLNELASPSPVDGVHIEAEGHRRIGEAMTKLVRSLLEEE